jgi:hypothetical protein
MLGNEGQNSVKVQLLPAASRGAGAANGAWIAVGNYNGELVAVCNTGAVTGSVAYKLQDALDGSGTSPADIAGATLAGAANTDGVIVALSQATRGFIRLVATVTTGPVLCSATLLARPKQP